jgi:glycosyltransferase involved in cell wall biosynthesis
VIEANACGTSVVASNSDGLRDSVRAGETGLLVPDDRPWADAGEQQRIDSLASALQHALSDPAYHSCMRQECLSWASRFSWDETARRMIPHIERAAGRTG